MPEQEPCELPPTNGGSPAGAPSAPSHPHYREEPNETEQEPEPSSAYDIVIFCHAHNSSHLVQALEDESQQAPDELPMDVLWSGESSVLHQGVIVLEWQGALNPAFLQSPSIDHEIFDYVVCGWSVDEPTDQEEKRESEPEERQE